MGCGDACPHVPAKHRYDWQIPDPRDMDSGAFRGVRDLIESRVRALLACVGTCLDDFAVLARDRRRLKALPRRDRSCA